MGSDLGHICMTIILIIHVFMLSLKSLKTIFKVKLSQLCVSKLTNMISCVSRLCERNIKENDQTKQYGDLRMKWSRIKLKKCLNDICELSLHREEGQVI